MEWRNLNVGQHHLLYNLVAPTLLGANYKSSKCCMIVPHILTGIMMTVQGNINFDDEYEFVANYNLNMHL